MTSAKSASFRATHRGATIAPLLLAALSATAQTPPFVGERAQLYSLRGTTEPMRLPTTVAVAADGRVLVADGVHDRLVVFAPDGALVTSVTRVGDAPLQNPVGIRFDAQGLLWIADAGGRRVSALGPGGEVRHTIAPPDGEGGRRADVTDALPSADGAAIWMADNDNHRLLRLDLASQTWRVFGQFGESLGQLHYPFQLAIAANGDVFVSDVANSRVQVFSAAGNPVLSIGAYGVNLGELYRPKGVAIDTEGYLWVSDSITGCIQVFRNDGGLLDVLRGADGAPLHFEAPTGVSFDSTGALYVVELAADQVQQVKISRVGGKLLPKSIDRARIGTAREARACTLCHVDWLPPFNDNRDSELMPLPSRAGGEPVVARSSVCLSCHDASISDSRKRVWDEHGHRTGISPPEGMRVPPHLPLSDGKVTCRTCHSAHGAGAPEADFRTAVLLRVPNQASELCMSCHTDKIRGPQFGTHPTGGMPWAVPEALIAAGAKVGPNPRELTCQVCHTPHGANHDHLLVMGTSSSELCVTCHDQMRPGMFREGGAAEHPLSPLVNDEQRAVIDAMGTRLGTGGRLICLSCHKLHHGKGERFLLAEDLKEGQMCLRCHSDHASLLGTPHDLRTNFPQERNRLGMTVATGGPCSSCHLFHRFARESAPGPGDRAGLCLSCHSDGKCAQQKILGTVNHPGEKCTECHNPHEPGYGPFVIDQPERICSRCHGQIETLRGGPHDALATPAWADRKESKPDHCLACHRPHGDETQGLFRVAPEITAASRSDGACLACHTGAAWRGPGAMAALHPQAVPAGFSAGNLPLQPAPQTGAAADADGASRVAAGGNGRQIGCATCHDPHGGAKNAAHLLRVPVDAGQIALCRQCHSDVAVIGHTGHAPDRLRALGFEADGCRPCHQTHGNAAEVEEHLMWPRRIARAGAQADRRPADTPLAPVAGDGATPAGASNAVAASGGARVAHAVGDRYCTTCHIADGGAPVPLVATHPEVTPFAPASPGAIAPLPLFSADGQLDAAGQITCRTCHLSHGRMPEAVVPAGSAAGEFRAQRLQLRPFVAPNVCTNCHGADALRRYLYFHDPARRGGPLQSLPR